MDFLMVHDLFSKPPEGEDANPEETEMPLQDIDPEAVLNILIQFLLRADALTRSICVEGLARLIFNKKL